VAPDPGRAAGKGRLLPRSAVAFSPHQSQQITFASAGFRCSYGIRGTKPLSLGHDFVKGKNYEGGPLARAKCQRKYLCAFESRTFLVVYPKNPSSSSWRLACPGRLISISRRSAVRTSPGALRSAQASRSFFLVGYVFLGRPCSGVRFKGFARFAGRGLGLFRSV